MEAQLSRLEEGLESHSHAATSVMARHAEVVAARKARAFLQAELQSHRERAAILLHFGQVRPLPMSHFGQVRPLPSALFMSAETMQLLERTVARINATG